MSEYEGSGTRTRAGQRAYKPISGWGYFWLSVLYAVPVIGWLFLIVHTFSKRNLNRRGFARSYWCKLLVAVILLVVMAIALVIGLKTGIIERWINDATTKVEQELDDVQPGLADRLNRLVEDLKALPGDIEPTAAEPEVVEPAAVEPAVTEPEVTEPEVAEPAAVEPEVAEPAPVEPEIEPEAAEPAPVVPTT